MGNERWDVKEDGRCLLTPGSDEEQSDRPESRVHGNSRASMHKNENRQSRSLRVLPNVTNESRWAIALGCATSDVHHGLPWQLRSEGMRKQHKTEHRENGFSIYPHLSSRTPPHFFMPYPLSMSTHFSSFIYCGTFTGKKSRVFLFQSLFLPLNILSHVLLFVYIISRLESLRDQHNGGT